MDDNKVDIVANIYKLRDTIPGDVDVVYVSKFHTMGAIMSAYNTGVRNFGESYVQELIQKYEQLPKDIQWHFIGHLQTNKVKLILPFVYLIQSVDSLHLLDTIQELSNKLNKTTSVLLEVHVAAETSKTGFSVSDLANVDRKNYPNVCIKGIMGMATNTSDINEIRRCFQQLVLCSQNFPGIRSFGMSDDYKIAIEEGANMIRIGSAIFGQRKI